MAKRKLENALTLMLTMEAKLHTLRNTFPVGFASIDDRRDAQIAKLTQELAVLKPQIVELRRLAKLELAA